MSANALQDQFNAIQSAWANWMPARKSVFDLSSVPQLTRSYSPTSNTSDAPILDPVSGLWKSRSTGAAWTGAVTKPDGTTTNAQNGKLIPTDTYGNPLPMFSSSQTVKQPGIADASNRMLAGFNDNSTALTKSFSDYLAQAKALNDQGAIQLKSDQAAVDPTDTINRLDAAAAKTSSELRGINRDYTTAQRGVQGDVAAENQAAAQTTADRLAKLKSDLDAQNAQYESASQDVAKQAYDKARQQLSLYQLGSGTPTSASGDLSNRYIRSYAAINIPLQQQLAERRYAQTGALDAQQQQADREAYQNLINQYAGSAALNTDLANRNYSTAQYTGNLDAATAAQIQQLKQVTAGMSRAQAATYLQQLAIPFAVGQAVLGGEISNLTGIQNIDTNANYYSLNTPYDASRVPATPYYSSAMPSRTYTGGTQPAPSGSATADAVAASLANPVSRDYTPPTPAATPPAPAPAATARTPVWTSLGGGMYTRNSDGATGMFDADGTFQPITG